MCMHISRIIEINQPETIVEQDGSCRRMSRLCDGCNRVVDDPTVTISAFYDGSKNLMVKFFIMQLASP